MLPKALAASGISVYIQAMALKKCAAKKPVIISQGQVAGSGGYWISMYGDEIVAGPNTVTGSIGVIGGWLYDKGFSGKLGMTADFVQRGKHADLGRGVTLPFIGLTVPARDLNDDERAMVKEIFLNFYNEFVKKVADGRNLSVDYVKQIAQGHFYSGLDGLDVRLVDKIGGLFTAYAIAGEKAGLKPGQRVEITEIPKYKGLFKFKSPIPFFGIAADRVEDEEIVRYVRLLAEENGCPLPMLLPGTYPGNE